jgi:hypothetical protein
MVLADLLCAVLEALRAEKPHTIGKKSTAVPELIEGLPQAQRAN